MSTLPQRFGLALGAFLGLFHLAWSILVASGYAQPFMDWILTLHSIKPFYQILPLNPMNALLLIIVASVWGYVMGWVLGAIWTKVSAKER